MSENNRFTTSDIVLATFLKRHGVELMAVEALTRTKSQFTFVKPSEELLTKWLAGDTEVGEVVSIFRHLTRGAKFAQRQLAIELGVE